MQACPMRIIIGVSGAILLLIAGAMAFAPDEELVTEIHIAAQPSTVWSVLTDGEQYADWNPFIVSMRGQVVEGATIENTMRPRDGGQMIFQPTVLRAEAERELRWLGRLYLPRVMDGEHYFLLTPSEQGTHLVHGEIFRGVALWFIDVEQFRLDFEAMNEALKNRVESGDP